MSNEIPLNEYLKRDNAPTFPEWLAANHPQEFERYKQDSIKFLFGYSSDMHRTDEAQKLYDEYDKFIWCRNEQERRFYFSGLLQDADIPGMSEFDLFGCADGSHSPEEIQSFKAELMDMQREYLKHPDRFFHPSADADSMADSTGADSSAVM